MSSSKSGKKGASSSQNHSFRKKQALSDRLQPRALTPAERRKLKQQELKKMIKMMRNFLIIFAVIAFLWYFYLLSIEKKKIEEMSAPNSDNQTETVSSEHSEPSEVSPPLAASEDKNNPETSKN